MPLGEAQRIRRRLVHRSSWKECSRKFADAKEHVAGILRVEGLTARESDKLKAQRPMSLNNWKSPSKRTYEDRLLLEYWQRVGGIIFTEVLVGRGGLQQWPDGAKPRRIDGVRIVSTARERIRPDIVTFDKQGNAHKLKQIVAGAKVEVIEVKRSLDRVVLGQVIIGADLLEMEYAPTKVKQVVVCDVSDPVLEAVCRKRDIKVWTPPKR